MHAADLTFGIEIECFIPQAAFTAAGWTRGAYHTSSGAVPGFPGWKSQSDGSLSSRRAGVLSVEVVSPVLQGPAGLAAAERMFAKLNEMGATVNPTCGFHVHVGWPTHLLATRTVERPVPTRRRRNPTTGRLEHPGGVTHRITRTTVSSFPTEGQSAAALRRLVHLFANHERGIYAMTGSLRRQTGGYSQPIKESWRGRVAAKGESIADIARLHNTRYLGLNLTHLLNATGHKTAEFRLFSPTTSWLKAKCFIQLALGLVHKATDAKSDTSWDSRAKLPERGVGNAEAIRLLYALGWIKGGQKTAYGFVAEVTDADRMEMLTELLRLAKKYDVAVERGLPAPQTTANGEV